MNTRDVLAKKEKQLAKLSKKSGDAVMSVRKAIDKLEATNCAIDATVEEIVVYQQRLAETRSGLDATKSKNQQIVQNFKVLLCEE